MEYKVSLVFMAQDATNTRENTQGKIQRVKTI